ncbi:hypothetical protein [Lichenicoccus roseus]|uniref:hypothetical protein n=1 Tax=Lichenicoccus roseus TaxID=2683649 RepID=UPI00197E9604|nr:hypothetical protein [Lichenicoccus roseus]
MFRKSTGEATSSRPKEADAKPRTGTPSAATAAATSNGKLAYEARRAAKAGVSLDRWMADKQKRVQAEQEAERRAVKARTPTKPGLFKRLLDRAHKPI